MKRLLLFFLVMEAIASLACDSGKGSVTPVKATVLRQQVNVPFDYRDCTAPASISFTVVASKASASFSVRILDAVTGVEYLQDQGHTGSTYTFPPLPAAGHFYYVELFNGSNGKINANIYAN